MFAKACFVFQHSAERNAELLQPDIDDLIELSENDILSQYIETIEQLRVENEILASLLDNQILHKTQKSRKRDLQMERRARRSFDSISHMTSSFGQMVENPTLQKLRELIALRQQRQAGNMRNRLPDGYEVLFPILHHG